MPQYTLVERKRLAVQRDLTTVALELFTRDGYERTTVDRIAEAAGMSRRTFFRYFASKDDVVVGKWELIGLDILAALRARPAGEDAWAALRHAFDVVVAHYADPQRREQSLALDAVVAATPSLWAAYLARVESIERRAAEVLLERSAGGVGRALLLALAGAASACLHAAMEETLTTDPERFPAALDATMEGVRPFA